jgi:hypothetical protein
MSDRVEAGRAAQAAPDRVEADRAVRVLERVEVVRAEAGGKATDLILLTSWPLGCNRAHLTGSVADFPAGLARVG